MARRRFFVDEVRNGRAQIEGEDAHHLTRVLRVERGQKYELSDNRNVYLAEVEAARKDLVSFAILEKLPAEELAVHITLLAALIKFDRFELLVEKATELGVAAIVPFMAERSEKGLDRAAEKRLSRWRRIAREASEQSRRATLPEIAEVVSFAAALAVEAEMKLALDVGQVFNLRPIFNRPVENSDLSSGRRIENPPQIENLPHKDYALLVGPEGGWTERERAAFVEHGWTPVSVGRSILRTETAAIAGIAIIIGSA